MSAATADKTWTSDELFALRPSQKVDRWLFRGELRESKVTKRNPSHSATVINCGVILGTWMQAQPEPRGRIYGGEAYFRIRKNPETNVGIDVAVATAEQNVKTTKKASFVDGPPLVAVEVLSPYDKVKDIDEAIEEYLDCGIEQVWIVDPYDDTLTLYRKDQEPVLFDRTSTFDGGAVLPGLSFPIAALFY